MLYINWAASAVFCVTCHKERKTHCYRKRRTSRNKMLRYQRQIFLPMLAVLVLIANPLNGWWMSKENCRKVVAISCRAVSAGGGAALGSLGGLPGTVAGAAAGSLLSEVCTPVSRWVCGKRSLSLVDPSAVDEFDRENHLYLFPQSFSDYMLENGKITLDSFIDGVNAILPEHIRGLLDIAKEFMDADKNGDGVLDKHEFASGSWIATDGDLAEMKREMIMYGMEF